MLRFSTGNLGDHKRVGGGGPGKRVMFGLGYRIDGFASDGARIVLLLLGGDKVHPDGRRGSGARIMEGVSGGQTSWQDEVHRNIGLSKDLREAAFAREFLLASIDEGVDLQLALGKVIRAMGVEEFAAKYTWPVRMCCARSTLATLQRTPGSIVSRSCPLRLRLAPLPASSVGPPRD